MADDDIQVTPIGLRTEFYNAIAQILTYKQNFDLGIEPTEAEKEAIQHLLDALGRYYYGPVCPETISTYYQDQLSKFIITAVANDNTHDNCPCVRSEKHDRFHRCKHGYYSG